MTIYQIENGKAVLVGTTSFQQQGLLERRDIQQLIRSSIEIIVPDAMVLSEEFGNWSEGRRRIDLLCLKNDGNLVVVELKRTEDGGHMELQAIRYAAMVSKMTFQEAIRAHQIYLAKQNIVEDAQERLLQFLEWTDPIPELFNQDVSIVLASAEFSKELTTAVMWLNEFELDITCVRLMPYLLDGKVLLNVEQIIPLPEAAEYQVRVRHKDREEREARSQDRDFTRFDLSIDGSIYANLPKRKLAYHIIQHAISKGVTPQDVLPLGRAWIIVDGEVDATDFEKLAASQRTEDSSTSEFGRFFRSDGELFHISGRTYALTKMWGTSTLETVAGIIERFSLQNISYTAVEQAQ